jgi:putative DNA primase/helicase
MEKINTAIMKQYSGGDRVTARGLFEDQDKFVITGKIFMSCNDLPTVSKMDNGTWRRIRVIPHVAIFKDAGDPLINPEKYIYEKDLDLENKLKKLRTPFLSLLVHYYDTRYLVHGLREPDCVSAASNRYKEENDIFMMFFNETYLKQPGAGPIKAIEVKKHFNEWKRNGNRNGDLKPQQVLDRMKEACGGGSTTSEFWSVAVRPDEADLSGALLSPVT